MTPATTAPPLHRRVLRMSHPLARVTRLAAALTQQSECDFIRMAIIHELSRLSSADELYDALLARAAKDESFPLPKAPRRRAAARS